ncbi:hypothetical protein [Collimonas arenae]|uniref:hypothetical protein n=1 Tax=Collimonas arenae TaxID=279058 RepID=UPI0012E05B3D|nr:hypothetical protein [Collimonas arenae]
MRPKFDRFGVPDENLRAAEESVKKPNKYELHAYVPTRHEVATLGVKEITNILTGWMCHSPVEIIPSRAQITEVKLVLQERPDATQLSKLVAMCDHYVRGD